MTTTDLGVPLVDMTAPPNASTAVDDVARAVDTRLSAVSVKPYVVGDGIADDTVAYQQAMNDAASFGRGLYHPAGVTCLLTAALDPPDGLHWFGDGDLSLLTSATAGTFKFCDGTSKTGIDIHHLRFRRNVDLGGDEGPYDTAIGFHASTQLHVAHVRCEGSMTGVMIEACTQWRVEDVVGYRNGDAAVRVPWSGSDGPGNPPAVRGEIVDCWAVESGYQLSDGTVLPSPDGPVGSGFVITQSQVTVTGGGAVDTREHSVETGDGLSGLIIDGFKVRATQADRGVSMLIADIDGFDIRNCRIDLADSATAAALVAVVGDGISQTQTNGVIESCTGHAAQVNGRRPSFVVVSRGSSDIVVRDCDFDGGKIMTDPSGSAGEPSYVLIDSCKTRNCGKAGFELAGGDGIVARDCRAIDNGQDSTETDPKQRSGFVIEALGAVTLDRCHAEDTRSGADRTQEYGYYFVGVTVDVLDTAAVNNKTAPTAADGSNTFSYTRTGVLS